MIPFLDFLKKKMTPKARPAAPAKAVLAAEKRSGERLSKTVMPNTTRTIAPHEEFDETPPESQPRVYSLGTKTHDLPPAVALALEPRVERVISLELSEIAQQMPVGWIRPLSDTEGTRRILLKAGELEKGMSSGRPSVCLTSIYHQVPEIFVRPVPETDQAQVPLPFQTVLEQFANLQTRIDQDRDQAVPQLETPFLRVTMEDNSRFGTTLGPVETADLPPVRVKPATAEEFAAAEPEAVVKAKFSTKSAVTRVRLVEPPTPIKAPPMAIKPEASAAAAEPTRIPFKISPIGTGAPASERVPASSGPSVPTSSSASTRIPFKMTPPANPEPWLTKESFANGAVEAVVSPAVVGPNEYKTEPETKISLALKPIMMALPPFQLAGIVGDIPDDARLEIPFSLVEPQLASGRVSIEAEDFGRFLPAQFQKFFSANEINAPVSLPLQDVLKNLPVASLRMRDDQEEQERGANFQTPFSAKAEEDAKRLNLTSTVARKPLKGLPQDPPPKPAEPVAEKPAPAAPVKIEVPAKPRDPVVTEELDAKTVVARVAKLPGVKGCAIMFGDGLSLAGNLPEEIAAEGLCAMAPSFFQRVESVLPETKLGALRSVSLSCAQGAVTFFMQDNLCLAALHAQDELTADAREGLTRAVHELSRKYSHPV